MGNKIVSTFIAPKAQSNWKRINGLKLFLRLSEMMCGHLSCLKLFLRLSEMMCGHLSCQHLSQDSLKDTSMVQQYLAGK